MLNKLSYKPKMVYGILFFIFLHSPSFSQEYIVPDNTDFAGIQLILSSQIKQEIASNVNAIYANQKFFEEIIEKTDLYFPVLNKIFEQSNIHKDLRYIAILESGLSNEPPKPSEDEAGIWKMKSSVAKESSLIINDQMDERMHFGQSTKAVANILLKSNSVFNNWIYSMLAFHVGQEAAMTLADYKFYSARKMSLDAKTHWYIIKAVSYKLAFENYMGKNSNPKLLFFEYEGAPEQTLTEIAEVNQIGTADVKDFNPWFFGIKLPPDYKKYTVFIPLHAEMGVKQGLPRELYSNMPPPIFLMKNGLRAVQAKFGDTHERLALASGITVELLKEYNEIGPFNKLVHGQICYIEKKNKKPTKDTPPFHIVKYGETLWSISQHYGMVTSLLRDFNWMYPGDELKPPEEPKIGQKLWLQQKRPKETGIEIVLEIQEPEFSENALANSEKMGEDDGWSAFEEDAKPEKSEKKPVSNNLNSAPAEVLLSNKNAADSTPDSEISSASDKTTLPGMKESLSNTETKPVESKAVTLAPEPAKETVSVSKPIKSPVVTPTPEPKNETAHESTLVESHVFALAPEPKKEVSATKSGPKDKEPVSPVVLSKEKNTSVASSPQNTIDENKNSTFQSSKGEPGVIYHTVVPNENLFRISLQYNVPIQKIKVWNYLSSNSVSVGQELLIIKDEKAYALAKETPKTNTQSISVSPTPIKAEQPKKNSGTPSSVKSTSVKEKQTEPMVLASSKNEPAPVMANNTKKQEEENKPVRTPLKTETVTQAPKEAKPLREGNKDFHIVGDKETLFGIANKYKMPVSDLMQLNNLDSYDIKQGQRIEVRENVSAAVDFQLHTVASGETLVAIALKYGYKVSEILVWNDRSTLEVNAGEKLKIKKK